MAESELKRNYDNPKMLLYMGDISRDMKYYKDAWKVSGKKYSKAKVSLGYFYFY